ncbi:subtilisin-like protease [Impatiens glandulifera]|uniref:subtilisin-like protease n=1 Tax=Impatiens glandulifera TaxID=253017 RepID=UPI001FB145E9|nr:subtilisin-like protease [Impatiens glandulifera]
MAFIFILVLLSMFNFAISQKDDSNPHEIYIVQLSLPHDSLSEDQIQTHYHSFLPSNSVAKSRMIHSYRHVMHGFAASLTPQEAMEMGKRNEVISIRPQRIIPLQTTHTPSFLGLNPNFGAWPISNFGKGVIIGVLDSGITPNHPAFNDDGLSPPPTKWKGKCELNGTVCNNKLIGARNFLSETPGEPIDVIGHGTHTASTAAGNIVFGANVFGQASGTAAGIAPLSHLAIYRVCLFGGCSDSDILAGMDAAIEDGVDVMSISIGGESEPFYKDVMAIGSYAAISKGIFVSCAAGNGGPFQSTVSNESPWILTVGASTMDRTIKATAVLGNQLEFDGESIFQPKNFKSMQIPLIFAGFKHKKSSFCAPGTLNKSDFKGKIVLCQEGGDALGVEKGPTVRDAGGVAMILANRENSGYTIQAKIHLLPATAVSYAAGVKILDYINSTHNPTATIVFKGTVIGDKTAPAVAFFSSRGPNRASPGILKPDIIGPGNNILAAWNIPFDKINSESDLKSNFNIVSGTSMATPHLTGIAALIKSAHPDWSPAAIKSAMMTTADLVNLGGTPILNEKYLPADIFAVGAGHVNPSKAVDPGLIYDLTAEDYVPYLCGLNYTNNEIKAITKQSVDCSIVGSIYEAELNYPTFEVSLRNLSSRYNRTVTNVGPKNSTYKVGIEITGVSIEVVPKTLHFSEAGQKLTYEVIFKNKKSDHDRAQSSNPSFVQGSLVWKSLYSKHVVRNRISVKL